MFILLILLGHIFLLYNDQQKIHYPLLIHLLDQT